MNPEQQLIVKFDDNSRVDEYRIRGRQVEFRARRSDGSALPEWGSDWRQLTTEDVLMHLALDTVVGEWLMLRLLTKSRAENQAARVAA